MALPPINPVLGVIFAASLLAAFVTPARLRWAAILIASLAFYALWSLPYLAVLMLCTLWTYLMARVAGPMSQYSLLRGRLITVGVALNLLNLVIFKYLSELLAAFAPLISLPADSALLHIVMPLGVSFYTFKAISYLLDVRRGVLEAETHPGMVATYLAFFPQMMAGPIERAPSLLPQLRQPAPLTTRRALDGLLLALWGAFKKLAIADLLARYVSMIYDSPSSYSGLPIALGTILFAFQLYADFSGYSDMSNGVAMALGFTGIENFNRPYLAASVREFWQRWHISLSGWVREYIFLPLARDLTRQTRNRAPRLTQIFTNFVTMGLIGLWHGATLPYLAWGLLHGLYLALESWLRGPAVANRPSPSWLARAGSILLTFLLVTFAWIFFRANSLADAWTIITHLVPAPGAVSGLEAFGKSYPLRLGIAGSLVALMVVSEVVAGTRQAADLGRLAQPVMDRFGVAGHFISGLWSLRGWWLAATGMALLAFYVLTSLTMGSGLPAPLYTQY